MHPSDRSWLDDQLIDAWVMVKAFVRGFVQGLKRAD